MAGRADMPKSDRRKVAVTVSAKVVPPSFHAPPYFDPVWIHWSQNKRRKFNVKMKKLIQWFLNKDPQAYASFGVKDADQAALTALIADRMRTLVSLMINLDKSPHNHSQN